MKQSWKPILTRSDLPLYEQIVTAMEQDINSGVLSGRLPAQRDLAFSLKLSVGTVTKAYVEAERRGLVRGHVGRGTFVGGYSGVEEFADSLDGRLIDLSLNVVPHQAAERRFSEAISRSSRRPDFLGNLGYAPPAGPDNHRIAGAKWIEKICNLKVDWCRLAITSGAQQAMALSFGLICKRNDTVICEQATFYGIKSLPEQYGYKLLGCATDEEGLIPAELDRAIRSSGAKVLYVMPTVQNPTASTMSKGRRAEIAKVVRRHKLWVVEDDNYALFAPRNQTYEPLASLLPDQCFYLAGVSKSIAPGLRVGFLICPSPDYLERILKTIRATVFSTPGWGGVFLTQWIEDGSAFEIAEATRKEVVRRAELAKEVLGSNYYKHIKDAPHFWIPLPELEAERVAGRVLRAGVRITPPAAPMAPGTPISGIRICLGGAPGMRSLKIALGHIKNSLISQDKSSSAAVI